MAECPVTLARWVGFDDRGQWYARPMSLPFPPFPGLLVPIEEGCDPWPVRQVVLRPDGGVVCVLEEVRHDEGSCPEEGEWPGLLAYHTEGWAACGDWPPY